MGSVVIMLLAYLMQQGFLYNSRQALEMYTFRAALAESKKDSLPGTGGTQPRGVMLTVIRDIIVPSFFSGLSRQRLMASASIDHNPYILYLPDKNSPEHISQRQLMQIGDPMIKKGYYFEVPPTMVKVVTEDNENEDEDKQWSWTNSAVSEIDPQSERQINPGGTPRDRISEYNNTTAVAEVTDQGQQLTPAGKYVSKTLESNDTVPIEMTFESAADIIENYQKEDWEDKIVGDVEVDEGTIPKDARLEIKERLRREKNEYTPNPAS
jgi:uncharacterized protein YeeX (DUF496 family)